MAGVWTRRLRRALAATSIVVLSAGCQHDHPAPQPSPSAAADPAIARTASGLVRGLLAPDHRIFAGIPYAAPPVGPLRFAAPAAAPAWRGVRDATAPGPRCLQDPAGDPEAARGASEDCLTLNVWTPAPAPAARPVIVWIHGGAFINGSGDLYDSRWLVSRGDVVVVTLNYRLGALGFLADPALGSSPALGNFGLADQQVALRWVHDNIAAFGGDPAKVTIAGESAGAMSVCDHLVAPGSDGLFRAAILQSGPCQAQLPLARAQEISRDYSRDVGCPDPASAAECLRTLPAKVLRKPLWYFRIGDDSLSGPVTGTQTLPIDPMGAFARGDSARVPLLIGSNSDEYTLFVALRALRTGAEDTAAQYPGLLGRTFGAGAAEVAAHYPPAAYGGSVPLAYSSAVTDAAFACIADRIAQDTGRVNPVYAYEFADRGAPAPDPLRTVSFPVGASHSLELRYLFDIGGAPPLNEDQQVLSDQMIDHWVRFAADGVPGTPWPPLGADGRRIVLRPGAESVSTDFGAVHQCGFWSTLRQ